MIDRRKRMTYMYIYIHTRIRRVKYRSSIVGIVTRVRHACIINPVPRFMGIS